MQPNGMIFWDWNGTLMDDVDFTHGCLNWMLESHGYPQRYDLAQYRELFRFPLRTTTALPGLTFPGTPTPCWQSTLWRTTMPGWTPAR